MFLNLLKYKIKMKEEKKKKGFSEQIIYSIFNILYINNSVNYFNINNYISIENFNINLDSDLFFIFLIFLLFVYFILFKKNLNKINKQKNHQYQNLSYLFVYLIFLLIILLTNFEIFTEINNLYEFLLLIFFNIFFLLSIVLFYKFLIRNFSYEEIFLIAFLLITTKIIIVTKNFLLLIILLEIQTFSILLILLSNHQNIFKAESALKYFILNSIASILLFFSISNIYAYTGLVNWDDILIIYHMNNNNILFNKLNIKQYLYFFLFFLSICLKIGIFPFHNWVIDVYQGFYYKLLFISNILQKPLLFYLLFKIAIFLNLEIFNNIFIIFIIGGLLIGTIGAFLQSDIKKFIAYTSIISNSYFLVFLINNFSFFKINFLLYLIFYNLSNFIFYYFFKNKQNFKNLYNYLFINKFNAVLGIVILFSFIGMPFLYGFTFKFFILYMLIYNKFYTIAIIILVMSMLSAFYYLRIIKTLMIDSKKIYLKMEIEKIQKIKKYVFFDDIFFFMLALLILHLFKIDLFNYIIDLININIYAEEKTLEIYRYVLQDSTKCYNDEEIQYLINYIFTKYNHNSNNNYNFLVENDLLFIANKNLFLLETFNNNYANFRILYNVYDLYNYKNYIFSLVLKPKRKYNPVMIKALLNFIYLEFNYIEYNKAYNHTTLQKFINYFTSIQCAQRKYSNILLFYKINQQFLNKAELEYVNLFRKIKNYTILDYIYYYYDYIYNLYDYYIISYFNGNYLINHNRTKLNIDNKIRSKLILNKFRIKQFILKKKIVGMEQKYGAFLM